MGEHSLMTSHEFWCPSSCYWRHFWLTQIILREFLNCRFLGSVKRDIFVILIWLSSFGRMESLLNLISECQLFISAIFVRSLFFFLLLVLNYLDSSIANIGSGWTFVRHPPKTIYYSKESNTVYCPEKNHAPYLDFRLSLLYDVLV